MQCSKILNLFVFVLTWKKYGQTMYYPYPFRVNKIGKIMAIKKIFCWTIDFHWGNFNYINEMNFLLLPLMLRYIIRGTMDGV